MKPQWRHRHRLYGHADWARHKSRWRHAHQMFTIVRSSGALVALGPPVISFCTVVAMFVAIFNRWVSNGLFPQWVPLLAVSSFPFTISAPSLAILLVFRLNATFGRFEEARRLWGLCVIRTRIIARQGFSWICSPADATKLQCFVRHNKAFPFCLKDHLTDRNTVRQELIPILEPQELESVMSAGHRPNHVMQVMSEIITCCQISVWERMTIDKSLEEFQNIVGACERIFNTPIPVPLTRLTSRILTLWHIGLPFGLWNYCGWLTIPITFISATGFFYIEEVGVMIEEPFWVLDLLAMSNNMKLAVEGIFAAHKEASLLCHRFDQESNEDHQGATLEGPTSVDINPPSTCLCNQASNEGHMVVTFEGPSFVEMNSRVIRLSGCRLKPQALPE